MNPDTIAADDITTIVHDQADRLFRNLISPKLLALCEREPWPAEVWAAIEESGLPLALAPEARGGIGLSMAAVGGLIALAGYHTVPLPLAETILAQALWSRAAGKGILKPAAALNTPVDAARDSPAPLHGAQSKSDWLQAH